MNQYKIFFTSFQLFMNTESRYLICKSEIHSMYNISSRISGTLQLGLIFKWQWVVRFVLFVITTWGINCITICFLTITTSGRKDLRSGRYRSCIFVYLLCPNISCSFQNCNTRCSIPYFVYSWILNRDNLKVRDTDTYNMYNIVEYQVPYSWDSSSNGNGLYDLFCLSLQLK